MITFYVATLARYVLVEADDERQARELGPAALAKLDADLRERIARGTPINIRTVRPATDDEIELQRWHNEMAANEQANGR